MLKLLVVVAGFAIGSAFIAAALALPSSSAAPASSSERGDRNHVSC